MTPDFHHAQILINLCKNLNIIIMKTRLYILAILLFTMVCNTQAQSPFQLNQVHHLKIKNFMQYGFPRTFINENGWVFIQIGGADSLQTQSLQVDSSTRGSILMAFDDKMRLRWSFVYQQGVNTAVGGMIPFGYAGKNSFYVGFGVQDSLVLPGIDKMKGVNGSYWGIIDSFGYFTKIKQVTSPMTSFLGTYSISNNKLMCVTSDFRPYIVNPDLEVEVQGSIRNGKSAVINPDGTAYYCHVSDLGRGLTIMDTTIEAIANRSIWVLSKVNKDGEREWSQVLLNSVPHEANDNKLLRIDKHGNVFWAVQFNVDLNIQGKEINFYSEGNTNLVAKAGVFRFSPEGKLLSAHYDTSTRVPIASNRQTIWLENDKDMNVYAYLYTSKQLNYFDKIAFGEQNYHRNNISLFDEEAQAFTKAWHVYDPGASKSNIGRSMLAHRQVFWYSMQNISSHTFHDGTRIEKYWNDDRLVAVYDTLAPKFPVGLQAKEEASHALVRIYPNPSTEDFVVQNLWSGTLHCKLYSIDGKQIGEFNLEEKQSLSLDKLTLPGVYLLKSTTAQGQSYSSKLIKQ
jgi:hypothetical protein